MAEKSKKVNPTIKARENKKLYVVTINPLLLII
jgi:hypothetical protein